ncbi:MAG: hypothetical protein AAFZ07_12375 [Actinomycetota bacterium]
MSEEEETGPESEPVGDAAAAALSHLQAAALELISAGRSFLDAADSALRNDESMSKIVDSLADLGRDVVARAAPPPDDDEPDDGYEGIRIDG